MEAIVLNKDFESVALIDNYKSFIWTERFDENGEFELHIPIGESVLEYIQKGFYIWKQDSDYTMVIETLNIEFDDEEGAFLSAKGKSLESLLSRRIVWVKRVFAMDDNAVRPKVQDAIQLLLKENVYDTGSATRNIPNFIFERSDDPKITELEFEGEYLGQNMYDVVSKLCKEHEIGFKLSYHEYYEHTVETDEGTSIETVKNALVFRLIAGVDRSYEQTENPYVIFSPEFENILNTKYLDSDSSLKNVVLVVGKSTYNEDGTEETREQEVFYIQNTPYYGLDRREIFVDATSLSTDDGYGGELSPERYHAQLKQKGIDALMENTTIIATDGELDGSEGYVYRQDYFIGDIVQIADEYGHEGQAYVSEYVMTSDNTGIKACPTFKAIQKGVYET